MRNIENQIDRMETTRLVLKLEYPVDTRFTETESISRILGLPGVNFRKYLSNANFFKV